VFVPSCAAEQRRQAFLLLNCVEVAVAAVREAVCVVDAAADVYLVVYEGVAGAVCVRVAVWEWVPGVVGVHAQVCVLRERCLGPEG